LNYSTSVLGSPNAGGADADDNGVNFASINGLSIGATTTADVTVSTHTATARVCGWIDFNVNGTFETNERSTCIDSPAGAASTPQLTWTIPAGASVTAGTRQGRVRVSYDTTNVQNPTGRLDSGEVEDALVIVNAVGSIPPLNCATNMYALLGKATSPASFRTIATVNPLTGAVGTTVTQVPTPNSETSAFSAALAISSDGTKVFVPVADGTLRVYDVATNAWVANAAIPNSPRALRATVTNNGIGYLSESTNLYRFSTTAPYTVTGPVTINVINPSAYGSLSPAPTITGSGDFFADSSGNLFLSVNTAGTAFLDTFRIAANGNAIFLGRISSGVTADTYGGYAALPSGIYASSTAGRVLSVSFDDFSATQTVGASTVSASSDLSSCYYPLLTPNVVVQKTATKVAGSSGTIVRSGDTLEYNIVVRNIGTLATAGATFQDSIPAGTTYVAGSTFYNYNTSTKAATALADDAGGVMPFVTERHIESPEQGDGTLLVDKTTGSTTADRDKEVLITFRVTVNAGAVSVQNQGIAKYIDDPGPPTYTSIVSDDPGTPATNDSTNISVENADLVITKDDAVTSVVAGGATTYTITVTNNGPFDVTNPVIADPQVVGIVQKTVTCAVPASGTAVCPTVANLTLANFKAGIAIPAIPVGQSVIFTLTADISATSGTVSNVATITSTITDPDTSNNTATDSNTVTAPTAITADTPQKEARFTAVPDLPTIYRGAGGSQIITITNNGPDSATNAIATFKPVTQTGVSVTAVSVVGGGVCTFAAGEWTCPTIPTVANAGTFQLNVTYATTSAAALGQAPQAEIRVKSDEFNPGSGVNETLYKVWGSNQTNEIRPNGAFWVGYEGTGGTTAVGTAYDEANPILNAWPATQASPTGAYLVTANPSRRTSVYAASSTSAAPTISRIVTNMSTDVNKSVVLPLLSNEYAGDNRRAWEYRTGIYVPTAQSLSFCIANTSVGIDDGAYIMVDGVVQATQDTYVGGGIVSASVSLGAGYHALVYRISNQNTAANSAEVGAGGYGSIGVSTSGTCNTSGFDQWGNTAVPASVNIIDAADLSVTKTNSVSAVNAGGTTSYSIVVSNAGPSMADAAVFQDAAATGLTKTSVSCVAAGGAVCPTTPTVAQIEAGLAIPTLPSGGSVTFTVGANVTATSGSVANVATITAPAGTTEINSANNSATDTDTVTPRADLSISKTNSVTSVNAGGTTSYSIVISNGGPSAANAAVFQDAAATGLTKTSVSCVAAGGAVCPTTPTVAQIEAGLAIPTLPSGGSVTFTVGANVTATSGSVANIATVTAPAGTTEINSANNSATDTDTVTPNADLSITKTNSVSAVNAGGTTSYSIVISNGGPSAANAAVFQDAAATGLTKTSVSCVAAGGAVCPTTPTVAQIEAGLAIPTLPSGGSVTFTVGANVTATSGSVANIATVTAPAGTTEINSANNSATDTDGVLSADLVITKSGPSTAKAGDYLTYTLKVWNKGPTAVTDAVVTDIVPSQLSGVYMRCTATGSATCGSFAASTSGSNTRSATTLNLPADATGNTHYVTYQITALAYSTGALTNTATVSSATMPELNNADNSASQATTITVDAPVTTGNAADQCLAADARNVLTPTSFTSYSANHATQTLTAVINNANTAKGTGTNGALVLTGKASWSYGNPHITAATLTLNVNGTAYAVLTTVGASSNPNQATWTALNGATISPATVTLGSYNQVNTAVDFTLTLPTMVTTVNTATAVFQNISPTGSASVAGDDVGVQLNGVLQCLPKTDLSISKTNSVSVLNAGGSTSYSVVVTNAGSSAADGAVFQDAAVAGLSKTSVSCVSAGGAVCPTTPTVAQIEAGLAIPTLPSGGSATFTVGANVTAASGSVSNTATVSVPSGTLDTNSANNSATDTDTVTPRADLSITKTNGVTNVNAGASTSYSIVVSNAGPSAANAAVFQDAAATGLTKTSVSCVAAGSAVCPTSPTVAQIEAGLAIPTLPSGGSVTFTVGATVTATSGTFANTATITAPSGTTEINTANNSATDTDSVIETSVSIAGRVFTDNSGTTGNASNAYNSVQDAGEVGLAAVTVQLTNCSNTILASTKTDALGDYTFNVLQNSLSAPNFCVVEQNGVGYTSVSGTSGYSRSADSITLAKTAATSYSGHNFGDARLGLMLTSDGQQTTTPAGTVSYAHTLTTEAVLTPTFATTTSQQPNNAADQSWTTLLYLDNNCNGQVDGSEAPVGTLPTLLPNQSVCVVQRVNAPASASNGAQHVASLSASYVATVQGGATLNGNSQTRTDTTLVGTAGLDMTKQVRVVSSCPSNDSSSTGFVARNTAKNGDFLEYEIIYTNRSARNLSEVVVRDAVPSTALFKSALCMSTPSGAACAVGSTPAVNANGTLRWNITGPVAPNAQGRVRFCVQVPALAEGPQ
jgi:uncharacterized repeat protein (TIGR01451 family)